MNNEQMIAFREWFNAQWLGDQEHGQYIPHNGDPKYTKYLDEYSLALGAWAACLQYNERRSAQRDPITVWEYYEAPEELRISDNGGDEDWLAEIPPHLANEYIGWLEEGHSFGCCCVDEHDHPTKPGWKIKIGCHA